MKIKKFIAFIIYFALQHHIHAMQSDIAIEEYYEGARAQTGVARIHVLNDEGNEEVGTGNLVSLVDENLKGRVLITCSHVLKNFAAGYVVFIDEENRVEFKKIQQVYLNENYLETNKICYDVAFLLLKSSIDTERFKPLSLNSHCKNEELINSSMRSYGCSPLFNRLNSNIIIMDELNVLRRRFDLVILTPTKAQGKIYQNALYAPTHAHPKGLITLYKPLTTAAYLKHFIPVTNFENDLPLEEEDKKRLMSDWQDFMENKSSESKRYQLNDYYVTLLCPLPDLSGRCINGDSGGAWLNESSEIVALNAHSDNSALNTLTVVKLGEQVNQDLEEKESTSTSAGNFGDYAKDWMNRKFQEKINTIDLKTYFGEIENLFQQRTTKVFHNHLLIGQYGVPLFENSDWINDTLSKMKLAA